jgi:ssDNA-binding Zn-finger/Zn-ribbon topoisomerase 1
MKLRTGRNGSAFLGCTAYPVCRNTVPVKVAGGKAEAKPDVPTGEKCPNCGHDLVTRHGRFGDYVACSNYPECRFKPPKPVTLTGVKCPVCKTGDILVRRGRFGPFYGCSNYPTCEKNFKARPVPKACPNCKAPYLLVRDRKAGPFYVCETEGCGLDVAAGDLDAFEPTTRIPEGALEAAIAEARTPAPVKGAKKRAPRAKATAKAMAKESPASPDDPPPSTARSRKPPARPRRAKK